MTVIIHSRSNFYERNLPIYWYQFLIEGSNILIDSMLGGRFLRVPETKYYEFGGNLQEAIEALTDAGIIGIVEGKEL
jgi:hypothetical protein